MGELRTISMEKSKMREEQLRRERAAEERRKKELREKRKKMRQIRFFAVWTTIILSGLIIVLLIVSAITGENKDNNKNNTPAATEEETTVLIEEAFNASSYKFTQDMYRYENSVEILEKLENLKYSHEELSDIVDFMLENEEAYPENLIKLVTKNPEAIIFAAEYPFKCGQSNDIVVDISEDYVEGEIPLLLQWDDRWGYVTYGDDTIALDGCGPTCLSMVAVGLTGNTRWTPVRVARTAMQRGYYVEGQGTAWSLMYEGCADMGLEAKVIGLSEAEMVAEVEAGRPIIASMAPGDFTDVGHFIVIVGYEDGKFIVNDPNSRKNSERRWSYDTLKGQIKNMWSFALAE